MQNRTPSKSGFTLIEILAVVAIIIIVAGLVLGISGVVTVKMDTAKAQKQMAEIAQALDTYREANGEYPPALSSLSGISTVDPWGTAFAYARPSKFSYRLFSLGPDGKPGVANFDDDKNGTIDNAPGEWGFGDDVKIN